MSTVTVSTALDRIARLIPTSAGGSSRLTGDYAAVCTPWQTLPERFQQDQRDRTEWYLSHHDAPSYGRVPGGSPEGDELAGRAPRYIVTSYGVPVAWVTLDGRTHFHTTLDGAPNSATWRTITRHRDAIRAAWPERFVMDSMGDPVGEWPLGTAVPADWQPSTV